MVVGVLRLDLRLFKVQSLKQKRSVVSRILSRLRSRYPVSAAEVGSLDLLQRTQLGISMTAGTEEQSILHSGLCRSRIWSLLGRGLRAIPREASGRRPFRREPACD